MGSRVRELIDRLMEKVRELLAPPPQPVPVRIRK
jgi:hypothetical protein